MCHGGFQADKFRQINLVLTRLGCEMLKTCQLTDLFLYDCPLVSPIQFDYLTLPPTLKKLTTERCKGLESLKFLVENIQVSKSLQELRICSCCYWPIIQHIPDIRFEEDLKFTEVLPPPPAVDDLILVTTDRSQRRDIVSHRIADFPVLTGLITHSVAEYLNGHRTGSVAV
ncbi:hypothetical protein MLD38_026961 [Melastoma candidum]|uniref:Uncharacterized protein n=1 Tax=Melastoma candidum TaxID=119954 RepID=A0ACB9P1S2_9MYRT|nr:hypothetical protein MLD38_026961 [Melastoma candidum]